MLTWVDVQAIGNVSQSVSQRYVEGFRLPILCSCGALVPKSSVTAPFNFPVGFSPWVVLWVGRWTGKRDGDATSDHEDKKTATAIREGAEHEPYCATGTEASTSVDAVGHSLRHSSGDGLPTLALPSLEGSAGEAVDGAALSFLTAQAVEAKRNGQRKAAKRQQEGPGGPG